MLRCLFRASAQPPLEVRTQSFITSAVFLFNYGSHVAVRHTLSFFMLMLVETAGAVLRL